MRSKLLLTVLRLICILLFASVSARCAFAQEKPAFTASQAAIAEAERLRAEGIGAAGHKQYKEAEKDFLAALEKAKIASDIRLMGALHNDLGMVNEKMQRYNKARDYYILALHFYAKRHETARQATLHRADILLEIGSDLFHFAQSTNNTKQYAEALQYLKPSLHLYESEKDVGRSVTLRYDIAVCLENLGEASVVQGGDDEALQSFTEALTYWQERKYEPRIASCLNGIARAYFNLMQYEEAQQAFTQALTHYSHSEKAKALCLAGRGAAYVGLHKYKEAQADFRSGLAVAEQLHDSVTVAQCRLCLSLIQPHTGGKDTSSTLFRSLDSAKVSDDALSIALNLLTDGSVHLLQGHTQTAITNIERALPMLQKLHATPYLTACWNLLAEAYTRQGQFDKAQTAYRHAIDSYEAFSEQVGDPGQLGLLQKSGPNLYAHYARLLVQQKRYVHALLIVEQGRAQGLARQAAQNQVAYNASILSRAEAVELSRRTDVLRSASKDYFIRHRSGAQTRYEQAKRQRDLLNTALYKRHAAYKRLRGAEPPTFDRLQTLARQHPDTLYLEWAIVDEKTSLLFAFSHRHGLQAFPLPYGSKTLSGLTDGWRDSLDATRQLTDRHTPFEQREALLAAQKAEPQTASELYTLLFSCLEHPDLLSNVRRLVFVTDGPLLNLPFAALRDMRGKRLVERYALSSALSLGTLLWPPNPRQPQKTLLCLADPTGDTSQEAPAATAGATSGNIPRYGPLPFARQYGTEFAASIPGTLLYVGQKAQKAVIMPQLPDYAVLLFATHGEMNPNNGLRSALIVASASPDKRPYDRLEAREIFGQQLSARLAILAACVSGLGQESGGEGLLGLAWAFRAAGCPCVTASQWSVDDAATSILMRRFWDGLRAHKRKDDALREAMLQVQHNPAYPRAYYWAAFQVMGDTGPISIENIPSQQSVRPPRH